MSAAVAVALLFGSCTGLHSGPRLLAGVGAVAVAGGSGMWATGELQNDTPSSGSGVVTAGFVTVVIGLAAIVIAGGWMAASVACENDPDCPDEEQCREVPAPPGGIPYKQCIPR